MASSFVGKNGCIRYYILSELTEFYSVSYYSTKDIRVIEKWNIHEYPELLVR